MCSAAREVGYGGIEIAPFTLNRDPSKLSAEDRLRIRRCISDSQLEFVGLHWLLVSPEGFHATTLNRTLRKKTWAFIRELIDLCADFNSGTQDRPAVMVLGSPKQRSAEGGASPTEAVQILTEELAGIAPHAARQNVKVLLEALAPDQTNVVNTIEEAVRVVEEVNNPAVQTMFDVHNAAEEAKPHVELIREFFPYIQHVHVNETDGREPGTGSYDFAAILSMLKELHYSGWVSLEVFDLSREGREVAGRALRYLKETSRRQTETQKL